MACLDLFSFPTDEQIEAAHVAGMQNWKTSRENPYEVAGEPVAPLLWWAWDMGRRLGEWLEAERVKKFEEALAARRELAALRFLGRVKA